MNLFWKMWKKVYSREVLDRVDRVTVNTPNFCFALKTFLYYFNIHVTVKPNSYPRDGIFIPHLNYRL